ncbi:tyrosine-type recombinase/integrase [Vibrio splendidus]
MNITDSKLKSLHGRKHDGVPIKLTDRDGLYVYYRASGALSFVFRYRYMKKPKDLALGRYPVMSLIQARAEARRCNEILAGGMDPKVQRDLDKKKTFEAVTVKEALEYWLLNYAEKHRKNYVKHRSQFEKHVYPLIGHLPLEQCETRHWVEVFDAITNGVYHRPAPKASGYILQSAKQALKYCRVRHFAKSHVLDDLTISDIGEHQGKRDRVLTWEELQDVLDWTKDTKRTLYYRNLLQLLIVFGCRTQELRLSTKDEWDMKRMVWSVPKVHSKTGSIILRPIPESMRECIQLLKEHSKTEYILGSFKRPEAVSGFGGSLWKKLEHKSSWTLHDLRRTFATRLNDMEIEPYIVEQLLGHALAGSMGVYNRSQHLEKKKRALESWVGRLVQEDMPKNVLTLRG